MKLTINRIVETSRFLATEAGQQLADLITYISDVAEQTIRALRNGLTFADNVKCIVPTVDIVSGKQTPVNTSGQKAIGVIPIKVSGLSTGLESFQWENDDKGTLQITATTVGGKTGSLTMVVLFG